MKDLKFYLDPIGPLKCGILAALVAFLIEIICGSRFEMQPLPFKEALPAIPIGFSVGFLGEYIFRLITGLDMWKYSGSIGLNNTWLKSSHIVHRGYFSGTEVPENSLAAFERAIQHGYGFELDVQISSDGTVFVFHDDDLARLTGHEGKAREKTYNELRGLRLYDTDQHIPTFAETLELVGGRVPMLIEIKSDGNVGPCEAGLWELLRQYKGEYAVQSFNADSVAWFRRNAPEVTRGQLISQWTFKDNIELAELEQKLWHRDNAVIPDFLACDMRALPHPWVDEARKRHGIPVLAWTARSIEEYNRMRPYADNVIFEGLEPPLAQ